MIGGAQSASAYGRAQLAVAYGILLATCIAGVFHAPWWAAVAGACSLALMSLMVRTASVPQMRTISEPVIVLASVLNAFAAASGVFIFGHVARWLWGL